MNEIFKAIFDRLTLLLASDVYDHVPQDLANSKYPFTRIKALSTNNNDVDEKSGFIATIEIISYSQYRGSLEINNLSDEIYNALQRWNVPVTANYGVSSITESFRRTIVQKDGLTRNSVQQYQLFFEKLT